MGCQSFVIAPSLGIRQHDPAPFCTRLHACYAPNRRYTPASARTFHPSRRRSPKAADQNHARAVNLLFYVLFFFNVQGIIFSLRKEAEQSAHCHYVLTGTSAPEKSLSPVVKLASWPSRANKKAQFLHRVRRSTCDILSQRTERKNNNLRA